MNTLIRIAIFDPEKQILTIFKNGKSYRIPTKDPGGVLEMSGLKASFQWDEGKKVAYFDFETAA